MKKRNISVLLVAVLCSFLFAGCHKEMEISIINLSPEETVTKVKIWQVTDIKTYQSWNDIQKIENTVELLGTAPLAEENVNILRGEVLKFLKVKSDKVYIMMLNNKVWYIVYSEKEEKKAIAYLGVGFYITNKSLEPVTKITVWQFPKVLTSKWGMEEVIQLLESSPVIDQSTSIAANERKFFELNSSNAYVIMVNRKQNSQNAVKIISEGGELQDLVWNGQTID
jgi:hypothetical protein